ncbi:acetolactate decarboxylase (plasmid) [Nicoliella spurrieriana]|uniref:Alpha-acetolactate decarboxylase n=1 Tax=Nicoliella spurrieriana TaxID=2925830 RepID=A0A976X4J1_9LACO|nr:acetolactate decarboxylase [Nicoliella spurrieriana]UQS85919.1 acetolactate decarboxylase [Nicoliella spurrieriana]
MTSKITLFQHGTGAMIVPGLFDGTIDIQELLTHGDTGIGSGDGLDGESIINNGTPLLIRGDGSVTIADDHFTVPFVNAHFAAYSTINNIQINDFQSLGNYIFKHHQYQNILFSVKLHGQFEWVKTRSVFKQSKPYPSLVATAKSEKRFESQHLSGTVIAYYYPDAFSKFAVGGFHAHFISDDQSIGGHLMNFSGFNGDLGIQKFKKLDLELPIDNADYLNHDFKNDDIEAAINQAERES